VRPSHKTRLEGIKIQMEGLIRSINNMMIEEDIAPYPPPVPEPPKPQSVEFQVGDLVKLVAPYKGAGVAPQVGAVGVVRKFHADSHNAYGVEWAGFTTGHPLGSVLSSTSRRGWFVPGSIIEKA
jgi:hypothetical protein